MTDLAPAYPAHWEADVVLSDGATAHVRPITPEDADRMVAFYARVSDRSKYYRFFAPYPELSDRDVHRFTHVDHVDRVAFIVLVGDEMIGVGRYDRVDATDAEVAFLIEDAHQGRGLGSVLLEHLAQAGREHGIRRFVADTLPNNRRMIQVFQDAGYTVHNAFEEGVVHLEFPIDPTESSVKVMRSREHRAEAASVARLLTPRSVAVVGAGRRRGSVGHTVVRNLLMAGFTGPIYPVNPHAVAVAGVPAYPDVDALPGDVDLAVLAVSADVVPDVVPACARKGVHGLVVVSRGFAESGAEGWQRQRELVRLARSNGMRVVGPNCLGVLNTDPEVSLNASLSPQTPLRGRSGFFSQSGALGIALVDQMVRRGLGLSTFVSAGNRADVSGNDLMQYWADDEATDVVLLYLESIGNPRKFSRVARGLARRKPVVAVKTGGSAQRVPLGHAVQPTDAPPEAIEAMFRQSGVISVETLAEMFDVAEVLAHQPLPGGPRVAVVGNSDALGLLTAAAAQARGLVLAGDPVDLGPEAGAADYERALAGPLADPGVDSIVVLFAPTLGSTGEDVARVIAEVARRRARPVVTTFLGRAVAAWDGDAQGPRDFGMLAGTVPAFPTPEEAVRALAHATTYASWRAAGSGEVPRVEGIDAKAAGRLVHARLESTPGGGDLDGADVHALLEAYGVPVLPLRLVEDLDEALAAGSDLGWVHGEEVVLKATAEHLRYQPDLSDVWRSISGPDSMRAAWARLLESAGPPEVARYVVQPMAPSGVPVEVRGIEDPSFGPLVSVGLAGVPTVLLGDRAWRIPPLTDVDVHNMIREVRAAPLLLGWRGRAAADVDALEDLLHRVSCLTDDLPEVSALTLEPVLVGTSGLTVVGARMRLSPPQSRSDWFTRRLRP